tara:strand:- start:1734 stop:2291 length:558 start_codon:yes stop_codon:yes gene_type:complete
MMFSSTALASVMTAFRDITDVVINNDDQYDVYPGNFSKHIGKPKTNEDKYRKRRLQIWRNYETDKPKDEVLDKRLTQVSDAVNRIKALLLGKRARKNVAYQHTVQHWKEYHIEQAYKRREQRLLEDKQTQDNLTRLKNENAKLKEDILNLKTTTYMSTIQCYINDIQHTRQVHHLRTKGKLISVK